MNSAAPRCQCLLDTDGLRDLAKMPPGAAKSLLLQHLRSGVIGVCSSAWSEFRELYEDLADDVAGDILVRVTMVKKHRVQAARFAERLNSGFSHGPYNDNTPLFTASVAHLEDRWILTSEHRVGFYVTLGCTARAVSNWNGDLPDDP